MSVMQIILAVIGAYLAVGIVFAIVFVLAGVVRIDPAAARSSVRARLIFMPGAAALWPLLALRWARSARGSVVSVVSVVSMVGMGSGGSGGAQRKLHVVLWCVVGPIALAVVVAALVIGGAVGGAA